MAATQRLRRVDTDIVGELSHEMSEDFNKLLEYGLDPKVAHRLDDIFKTEKLSHSDLGWTSGRWSPSRSYRWRTPWPSSRSSWTRSWST